MSNIALGKNGVGAIDLFMDDSGAGNQFVGHRRWVLHPPRANMATGDTSGNTTLARQRAVTKEALMDGFGDNTVVFLPTGISDAKPAADTAHAVSVSNIAGAGVPPNIPYTVTVIDPASEPVAATAIAVE